MRSHPSFLNTAKTQSKILKLLTSWSADVKLVKHTILADKARTNNGDFGNDSKGLLLVLAGEHLAVGYKRALQLISGNIGSECHVSNCPYTCFVPSTLYDISSCIL